MGGYAPDSSAVGIWQSSTKINNFLVPIAPYVPFDFLSSFSSMLIYVLIDVVLAEKFYITGSISRFCFNICKRF